MARKKIMTSNEPTRLSDLPRKEQEILLADLEAKKRDRQRRVKDALRAILATECVSWDDFEDAVVQIFCDEFDKREKARKAKETSF